MIYKDREIPDVKAGDIILYWDKVLPFYDPSTILSGLVRTIIKSHYNHSGIVVQIWGKLYFMEALGRGIVCRPLEEHLTRHATTICILRSKTEVSADDISKRALSQCGKPYDYSLLLFVQLFFRLTGKWIGKTGNNATSRFVCTSFCAWCHNLPNWWKYSEKEFVDSDNFTTVYKED